ncbi:MAG: PTS sugar transporter subunit IIA [Lentisphaeraceae bacterium]|nr:PTS sugar transporter subunit IIA [Lentisphaeraceae bacterium]
MANDTNTLYLSTFFSEADILIEQTVPSVYNLVSTLVNRLAANHFPGVPTAPIIDAVLRRERSAPTVVGEGVGFPHARIEGIDRPYLALGIYPAGLPAAEGAKPLHLIFLLLVPESQPARYLQILRALSNLLREPGTIDRLTAATSPDEVMHFLHRSELKLPEYVCAGDLMSREFEALRSGEPLSAALDLFMDEKKVELPILDEAGRLVGAVDTRALLGCFIPSGFRKLFSAFSSQASYTTMGPLAERLRAAHRIRVCEAMNTDLCTCLIDTPAQEIAADLAERNAVKCYVLDGEQRLIGVIPLAHFFRRILKD